MLQGTASGTSGLSECVHMLRTVLIPPSRPCKGGGVGFGLDMFHELDAVVLEGGCGSGEGKSIFEAMLPPLPYWAVRPGYAHNREDGVPCINS